MGKVDYPVGDFITRVRNCANARKKIVEVPMTKLVKAVAAVLQDMGYLSEVKEKDKILHMLVVYKNKRPVLTEIKLVSKPGLRVYKSSAELTNIKSPFEFVVSTSKGVMSSKQAVAKNLGGEVIAKVL